MRCRHTRPTGYIYPTKFQGLSCNSSRKRCDDCGAWLSLGDSNDSPEEVQIEIRAAALAWHIVDILPLRMQGWTTDEEHGWRDHLDGDRVGDCRCRDLCGDVARNWHAGYLARAIATHEEQ